MRQRMIHLLLIVFVFQASSIWMLLWAHMEVFAQSADHIVISEIQTAGVSSNDEFVELYNPTSEDVDISSWSIQYKSATGGTYYKKNFEENSVIPAFGFFLVAHNDYQGDVEPDLRHASFSLSGSGGNVFVVASQDKLTSGEDISIIDKVGYGTGDSAEGQPSLAPESFKSIERKAQEGSTSESMANGGEDEFLGNGYDSDNNTDDFVLRDVPEPQNSSFVEVFEKVDESGDKEEQEVDQVDGSGDKEEQEVEKDGLDEESDVDEIDNESEEYQGESEGNEEEGEVEEVDQGVDQEVDQEVEGALDGNVDTNQESVDSDNEDGQVLEQDEENGSTEENIEESGEEVVEESGSQENQEEEVADGGDAGEDQNNNSDMVSTYEADDEVQDVDDDGANVNISSSQDQDISYSYSIVINEIFPNPEGDEDFEFIELKNIDNEVVDLDGWQIGDAVNTFIISTEYFDTTTIEPGGFFVIGRSVSGIALNNSGDEVKLLWPNGQVIGYVLYDDSFESKSYSRDADGNWIWTSTVTEGEENVFDPINHAPEAVIEMNFENQLVGQDIWFSAASSSDEDGDELLYFWQFGDGMSSDQMDVNHSYNQKGDYEVILTVYDRFGLSDTDRVVVSIEEEAVDALEDEDNKQDSEEENGESIQDSEDKVAEAETGEDSDDAEVEELIAISGNVIISEFIPNPDGNDSQEEWIELYNTEEFDIDLGGWQLDDIEGGSSPYTIDDGVVIGAEEYLVFYREDTGIALNNDEDSVRLFDSEGNLYDEVVYKGVKQNYSLALVDDEWVWTSELTPGMENRKGESLSYASSEQADSSLSYDEGVGDELDDVSGDGDGESIYSSASVVLSEYDSAADNNSSDNDSSSVVVGDPYIDITLSDIRRLEIGSKVRTRGIVTVEPSVLGAQIFYIQDESSGVQVYMYNKDFPELNVGDIIEVVGTLSTYRDEFRIKVRKKSDFTVLSYGDSNEFKPIVIEKIYPNLEGMLVSVQGELLEYQNNSLYLDVYGEEIKVYIKSNTGIGRLDFLAGEQISVLGIVSRYNDEYRILPRYRDDISVIDSGVSQAVVVHTDGDQQMNTEEDKSAIVRYLSADSKNFAWGVWHYILLTGIVSLVGVGVLAVRYYRKKRIFSVVKENGEGICMK